MSTTPRQPRPTKKAIAEPARFVSLLNYFSLQSSHIVHSRAWTGARASPTFSPPPNGSPRTQAVASPGAVPFPTLSQSNGARSDPAQDRVLQSLTGLTVRAFESSFYDGSLLTNGSREQLSHFKPRHQIAMKVSLPLRAERVTPLESH